jgi:selenium metabolism protein YedF
MGKTVIKTNPEKYCTVSEDKKRTGISETLICVTSQAMGGGDDEFGKMLMQGFIGAINQMDPLPQKIILYNTAVLLTQVDNPASELLKNLESLGVIVLACGTCVDHFDIKDKMNCGSVSNMIEILESLNSADKIIYP